MFGVLQVVNDALKRLLAGGAFEYVFSIGKIALHKLGFILREVGDHKRQRMADLVQPVLGIFIDHMHLENALAVMLRQGLKIAFVVFAAFGFGQHLYGHRLTEYRQAFLQGNDFLFVQKVQGALDGGQRVFDF